MPVRTADAEWKGDLKSGQGNMQFGNGAFNGPYSFASRFEEGPGTNPESLIAAAHAGCFSMALSAALGKAGFSPTRVKTRASAHLENVGGGFKITTMDLDTEADVPGIDEARLRTIAEEAKNGCPVSQALKGVTINLNLKMVKS